MNRHASLKLFCAAIVTVAFAAPAEALTSIAPLSMPDREIQAAPEPSVAMQEDMDGARVEKAYYGHWRRVNRRVYRRHHYYYHYPYHYYHHRYYY